MINIVIAVVATILVVACFSYYNKLVGRRNAVKQSDSDITVQLKRRYDLIPNLIESVKGQMAQEREVLQKVTEMRTGAINAQKQARAVSQAAEDKLSSALGSLFVAVEAYPDLKSSDNFIDFHQKLTDAEDKIQSSRRLYNSSLKNYLDTLQMFPSNIIAGLFRFTSEGFDFFDVDNPEEVAKPVES